MYTYKDIQWIRNVKRAGGAHLAYYEEDLGEVFSLNWSSRYKDEAEASKPDVGDLIVLFQKPNGYNGVQLTHLVTPIDNNVVEGKTGSHKWERKVRLIAKAEGAKNPKPAGLNFTPVNQTHSYHIESIKTNFSKEDLQEVKEDLQKVLWNAFKDHLVNDLENIESGILKDNVPEYNPEAHEGTRKDATRKHILRERNSKLVQLKKHEALSKGDLKCECCSFDFHAAYGELGFGFIECHHIIPINQGERITKKEDLALVCSNCHRMLHRKDSEINDYRTVKQLKEIIEINK